MLKFAQGVYGEITDREDLCNGMSHRTPLSRLLRNTAIMRFDYLKGVSPNPVPHISVDNASHSGY